MHVNSGYRDEALRARASVSSTSSAATTPSSRRRRRASARCGSCTRGCSAQASAPTRVELSELLVQPPRGRGRRRVVPAPRHLPPDVPLAARDARRRCAAAAAARRARARARRARPRAEECCGFGGTFSVKNADTSSAILADKCAAIVATRRRGLHRGRRLLPAADRRRARPARPARPDGAPRRDPRLDGDRVTHPAFPGAGARRARERAAAREPAQRDGHDPREARARRRRAAGLGGAPRGGPRDQGGRARAARRATCSQFEEAVEAAGGHVHWARDAAEANAIVAEVARAHGVDEVVKVKSLTTDEIRLNDALAAAGIHAARDRLRRADPAARRRLVVAHPRAGDPPQPHARSATSSPARSRPASPRTTRRELAEAARVYLRERFLRAQVGVSGANFGVAETGTICVVESEGNGRMCTTLPPVLVTVLGIEKLVPRLADLEVFLQLLPRSSTGERMNPYTSLWTGVTAGDGPQELHVVLLDNGRTRVLATRSAGRRCTASAAAPASTSARSTRARAGTRTARSTPGRSARSSRRSCVGIENAASLPFASSLCGACYEVCPVKIDIPRGAPAPARARRCERDGARRPSAPRCAPLAWVFGGPRRFALAQRLGAARAAAVRPRRRVRRLPRPLSGWTRTRDLKPVARADLPRRGGAGE